MLKLAFKWKIIYPGLKKKSCKSNWWILSFKLPETVTAIYVPAGVKEKMEKLAEEDENYAYYWPEEKLALIIELNV